MPDPFMQSYFVQNMLSDIKCYDSENECDITIEQYHRFYDTLSPEDFMDRFILLAELPSEMEVMLVLKKPLHPDQRLKYRFKCLNRYHGPPN